MSTESLLLAWARLLIDSLARSGVTDVVICPGSRSTPLAFAAAQHPELRCRSLIDERSAGFFAVGQAKITGRPTLLVCTSGTAAANCLPAAVEASASATPLVILTADRPFELQQCCANQTIDQSKLFSDQVRHFVELGMPELELDALRGVQRKAAQAALMSRWPVPGAVHINARARKPLEPPAQSTAVGEAAALLVDELVAHGPTRPHPPRLEPASGAVDEIATGCETARRGLIVCGPTAVGQAPAPAAVAELAQLTGFVVLCEAASGLRFALPRALAGAVFDGFDAAFRSEEFRRRAAADLILQLGYPPVSAGWHEYLKRHPTTVRHVLAPCHWPDPTNTATSLLVAETNAALAALGSALRSRPAPGAQTAAQREAWRKLLASANTEVWQAVDEQLHESSAALSEAEAVRLVVEQLPASALLAIGNSLPIREVETYCRARPGELSVWSQRGVSGIDGVLSGAAGAAVASGRPTTVLIGDISFLHDVGGLWAARALEVPFVVVVLNNDGGRIFEQLPLADAPGLDEATLGYFTTPHGLRLSEASRLYGCPAERVSEPAELRSALREAHGRSGCTLLEVQLPPHSATEGFRDLWDRVDRKLRALPGLATPNPEGGPRS